MWKSISIRKIKNNTTRMLLWGWVEDGWHVLTRSYSFSESREITVTANYIPYLTDWSQWSTFFTTWWIPAHPIHNTSTLSSILCLAYAKVKRKGCWLIMGLVFTVQLLCLTLMDWWGLDGWLANTNLIYEYKVDYFRFWSLNSIRMIVLD